MDPRMLSLLLKTPSLLQGIMGLFTPQRDPAQESGRNIEMLMRMFSPQNVGNLANQQYSVLKGSPMYGQAFTNLAAGAQQSSNLLTRNLANAGIAGSGVGQIKRSLAPSVMAGQTANLNSNVYSMGFDNVMKMLQSIMGAGVGMPGRSNDPNNLGQLADSISGTNWSFLYPNKKPQPVIR